MLLLWESFFRSQWCHCKFPYRIRIWYSNWGFWKQIFCFALNFHFISWQEVPLTDTPFQMMMKALVLFSCLLMCGAISYRSNPIEFTPTNLRNGTGVRWSSIPNAGDSNNNTCSFITLSLGNSPSSFLITFENQSDETALQNYPISVFSFKLSGCYRELFLT